MEILLVASFFAGMIFQALFMLVGKWEAGDFKKVFISFGIGLLAMLLGDSEDDYDLGLHFFLSTLLFIFTFTAYFRERILVRIGARTLLIWNILFLSLLVSHFRFSWTVVVMVFMPTVLTIINGFTDMDRKFGWQVFFYAWFSIMVASIGFFHFAFRNLGILFQWGEIGIMFGFGQVLPVSPLEMFLTGASFLYIISSAWYALALIPIPLSKRQTYQQRMIEVRKHMQMLAYGYLWQKDDFLSNFICAILFPLFLFLNYQFAIIGESTLISLVLVILPLIERLRNQGQYEFELHDDVGSLDKFAGYIPVGESAVKNETNRIDLIPPKESL